MENEKRKPRRRYGEAPASPQETGVAKKPTAAKADLEVILQRLKTLEDRIARLEGETDAAIAVAADFGAVSAIAPPAPLEAPAVPISTAAPVPAASAEQISEEVLLVISAAVAAFLGERAHIRQVRLLHSDAWAQQGRVSVMASHRWAVHR
jgi:methylmalonyl-CoA carboxyltransferase large subunit